MPLTPLLFAYAFVAQATPAPTAASLISKMFAHYAGAKTFSGRIRTTQTARGVSITTDTRLAYERPAKIRLDQSQRGGSIKADRTLASDGVQWEYTKPEGLFGAGSFLKEAVKPEGGPVQNIGSFYAVVGSNLPDRSAVLDTIVARTEDLRHFQQCLLSFSYKGKAALDGRSLNLIEGTSSDLATTSKTESFALYLTDDGDIVRYVLDQTFAASPAPRKPGMPPPPVDEIAVTTTWDVSGTVGAALAADAFKLPAP